ncbi:hypothetical protein [Treponema sp.]|uniref:hypothetical protein n=1 Tax=Treponema sp. TaxID=166 RepID=UPI00298DA6BE|nr:hypothetical protein [Treponema sp.]
MDDINLGQLTNAGFKRIGLSFIGKVDDYFFTLTDKLDVEKEITVSINIAPNDDKSKLFEYLDKEQCFKDYGIDGKTVTITFIESSEKDLLNALQELAFKLKEINAVCVCGSCDNTEYLAVYTNGTVHSVLCEKCGSEVLKSFEEEKNKNPNYGKGFFLSLIGALIGSIVWILIGMAGFYASIAGLAISFCAFKGYEIAGGKVTKTGVIINIITIAIAFFFAQYIGLFIALQKEVPELTFSLFVLNSNLIFTDHDILSYILPNMGLGLLFVVLGASRTISNNFNAAKQAEEFKIEKINF